jgi:hypothetical protein
MPPAASFMCTHVEYWYFSGPDPQRGGRARPRIAHSAHAALCGGLQAGLVHSCRAFVVSVEASIGVFFDWMGR